MRADSGTFLSQAPSPIVSAKDVALRTSKMQIASVLAFILNVP